MKNKAILIFIICQSIITKGYSGDTLTLNKSNRYIIGVSVGAAIPFMNFGSPGSAPSKSQYDSSFNGYAKTGFHVAVNIEVYLTQTFGLTGLVDLSQNSFNTTAYNNNIFYNEVGITSVSANSYNTREYMLGVFINAPFTSKYSNISLILSFMFGYCSVNFPTITTTYVASSTQSAGESTLSANGAHAFIGDVSFGLHDKISKHLLVSMDVSFSITYLEFSSGVYTETMQGLPPITTTPGNPLAMWSGLIKPTIGVGYIF